MLVAIVLLVTFITSVLKVCSRESHFSHGWFVRSRICHMPATTTCISWDKLPLSLLPLQLGICGWRSVGISSNLEQQQQQQQQQHLVQLQHPQECFPTAEHTIGCCWMNATKCTLARDQSDNYQHRCWPENWFSVSLLFFHRKKVGKISHWVWHHHQSWVLEKWAAKMKPHSSILLPSPEGGGNQFAAEDRSLTSGHDMAKNGVDPTPYTTSKINLTPPLSLHTDRMKLDQAATVRPRYHCLRFQILHAIYSQFSSLTSY